MNLNDDENPKASKSFKDLNLSKENMGKNTARLESNRPSMKSKVIFKIIMSSLAILKENRG